MKYIIVIISLTLLHGCNSRQVYDSLHGNQKIRCQSLPPSQYSECMEQVSDSYEKHTRERNEVIKGEQ